MGQRARLHRMFIVFRPNSIVSATEMAFFFFENFHFSDFFSCIGIQVRANLWSFSIGNGSTAKCPSEVLYLSAKFHRFGSEMAFFLKIFISVSFFFWRRNSGSRKFVKLFNWKRVNGQESIRGSSFSAKFHRFGLRNGISLKIYVSVLSFFILFLRQNSSSHKLVQLFDWK